MPFTVGLSPVVAEAKDYMLNACAHEDVV